MKWQICAAEMEPKRTGRETTGDGVNKVQHLRTKFNYGQVDPVTWRTN